MGIKLFSQAPSDMTRGNDLKWHQGRFWLYIRRIYLLKESCGIGTGFLGKWLCLEVFKKRVDIELSSMV